MLKQISTKYGLIEASDDCVVIRPHGEDVMYDIGKAVIHGPGKSAPSKPHLLLLKADEVDRATDIAKKALTGTEEFPDMNDIFVVPIYYGDYTVDGIKYYSI